MGTIDSISYFLFTAMYPPCGGRGRGRGRGRRGGRCVSEFFWSEDR